jgi:hypothetical protein
VNKVFIGGSRRLSRLSANVKRRLDNIVNKRLTVLIGDANGADRAVQHYLASKRYDDVIVFCIAGECRNNVGKWPVRNIVPLEEARRDFAYYAAKDRAMADETDYGLMLWDGKSRGTLTSVVDLMRQGKLVVVYFAPGKSFYTLSDHEDLALLVRSLDGELLQRIESDLDAAGRQSPAIFHRKPHNMSLF